VNASARHRPLRRAALVPALLLAVLVPATVATAQSEAVDPPPMGTVSGTVTDPGGDPVEGVEVFVGYWDGNSATTGADGTYEVLAPVGNNIVEFVTPDDSPFASEYWDDSYGEPTPLRVEAGAEVTGIDAELAVGATVSGSVGDPALEPVPGTQVWAYAWWDTPGWSRWAEVGEDGTYTITGLPPGNHVISFEPPYESGLVPEYWEDTYDPALVDLLSLGLGDEVTSIDAVLSEGGTITGTVTDPQDFGLPEIYVAAEALNGGAYYETYTDEEGNYELANLIPGSYLVSFYDEFGNFVQEWYDNATSPDAATPVVVTAGATTADIDAQMNLGGSISGRVTGLDGRGLPGVWVETIDAEGNYTGGFAITDPTGRYRVYGLVPGEYRVSFGSAHATEYYDEGLRFSESDPVEVVDESNTPGIDATLDRIVFGDDFVQWPEEEGTTVRGGAARGLDALAARTPRALPPSNDTRVLAHCLPEDPATFSFVVDGFDGTDGTTSGTIDFGDETAPFVFDSSGDSTTHTFPWPGGLTTGDPFEVTVTLDGGPEYFDAYTIIPGYTPCADDGAPTFTDVPADHFFFEEIECIVDLGVTEGFPDGTFRPTMNITRGMVAQWLWRYMGSPPAEGLPEYPDVPETHPFAEAIAWATEWGIATGYPDGTFGPGDPITRQQVAAWLWRLAGEPPADGVPEYTDVTPANPFAEAIAWLSEQGVITGYDDGTFRPGNNISRQGLAAWICRFADIALG